MGVGVAVGVPGAMVGVGVGVGDAAGVGVAVAAATATVMTLELFGMAAISSPVAFEVTTVLAGSNESVKGVETVGEPAVTVKECKGTGVLLTNPD